MIWRGTSTGVTYIFHTGVEITFLRRGKLPAIPGIQKAINTFYALLELFDFSLVEFIELSSQLIIKGL